MRPRVGRRCRGVDRGAADERPVADGAGRDDGGRRPDRSSGGGSGSGSRSEAGGPDAAWRPVESPADATLYGVVWTAAGAYAVGEDGLVLRRSPDGDWRVAVPGGPATKRNTLTDAAVSDDGERVWFAGSSGAIGRYDVDSGLKHDHSAPMEVTSTWEAVAVGGERGDERLFLANGSGEVLEARVDARGCPTWGEPAKPGGGSSIAGLTADGTDAYAVDTSGNVFASTGDGWDRLGIDDAQIDFTDVHVDPDGHLLVDGDGGIVHRYDPACENWTPVAAGTAVLRAGDDDGERPVAVGEGGHVFRRRSPEGWRREPAETEATLHDVAVAPRDRRSDAVDSSRAGTEPPTRPPDVAVGEDGAIVERARSADGDGGGAR